MKVDRFNKFLMVVVLLMGMCFILCDSESTSTADTAADCPECPVCNCGDITAPTIDDWWIGTGTTTALADGDLFVDNFPIKLHSNELLDESSLTTIYVLKLIDSTTYDSVCVLPVNFT